MGDWYGKSLMKDGDLQEDVWAMVKEREDSSSPNVMKKTQKRYNSSSSSSSCAWAMLPSAPRVIQRSRDQGKVPRLQSSAPMSIPDWSKVYSKKSNKGPSDDHGGSWVHHGHDDEDGHDVNDDDDDGDMVPPHEYITRRLARTQIASFSMCEGVGRTLKGRDLSKVRNAILTKTGFLE